MDIEAKLKEFLEELKHNIAIPNTTHVEIEYVIERVEEILSNKTE